MKTDLKNTTFIIPIYIESPDRVLNTKITLSYLFKHFDTNVIILEYDETPKLPAILKELNLQDKVNYIFSKNSTNNKIFVMVSGSVVVFAQNHNPGGLGSIPVKSGFFSLLFLSEKELL